MTALRGKTVSGRSNAELVVKAKPHVHILIFLAMLLTILLSLPVLVLFGFTGFTILLNTDIFSVASLLISIFVFVVVIVVVVGVPLVIIHFFLTSVFSVELYPKGIWYQIFSEWRWVNWEDIMHISIHSHEPRMVIISLADGDKLRLPYFLYQNADNFLSAIKKKRPDLFRGRKGPRRRKA